MSHVMLQADWDRLLLLINSREVYRTGQNGTSVYASGTTLTLAAMPFTPLDAEFRAVLEYNAGGHGQDQITVYWADEHPMHIDAGVLTVQRATFQATSTFRVIYTGMLTTPLATAGHDALLTEETKAETVMQMDPWKLNVTAWIQNLIAGALGQGGIWLSPVDFTATRTGATTLVLTNVPAGVVDALGNDDVQFRGVIEWTAAGTSLIWVPSVNHFDYNTGTGVLTVTGATFAVGSEFMVLIASQQKGIGFDGTAPANTSAEKILALVASGIQTLATAGHNRYITVNPDLASRIADTRQVYNALGGTIWKSPTEFTATRTSATQLTLTGLPMAPQSVQFLGVIEHTAAGDQIQIVNGRDGNLFTFTSTGPGTGTLDVTGAAFAATSQFIVGISSLPWAYDLVLNALQVAIMNATQWDFTDSQTLLSAVAINANDSGWVYVKGMTTLRLVYTWVSGAGAGDHHLLLTMYGNNTDAGTTEYEDELNTLGTSTTGAAVTVNRSETIDVSGYVRIKIKVDETGGTGKGTITLAVLEMNN